MQLQSRTNRYRRLAQVLGPQDPCRNPRSRSLCEPLERRLLLTAITTYHVDNQSTGVNSSETLLTPATVNVNQFGKEFSTPVDGQVFAEPLYVPNFNITGGNQPGTHNVVFVATEHATLYAIDSNGGNVLWTTSFLSTGNSAVNILGAATIIPFQSANSGSGDLTPEIGITSTPVIDPTNTYIYILAKTQQTFTTPPTTGTIYVQTLYKVALADGSVVGSAIVGETANDAGNYTYITSGLAANTPYSLGTGAGAITVGGQSRVYFNAQREFSRVGMSLVNGTIYMGFASHGDNGPYHGWMLAYNATNLAITGALNTTPNGGLGGIWQGGGKIVVDDQGYFYFETGNGSFNQSTSNFAAGSTGLPKDADYGDSFLKVAIDSTVATQAAVDTTLNPNGWGLKVVDFFSPANNNQLSNGDVDLGSGGPTILPDSVGSALHPHLLVGAGKEGKIYLLDRDNMGGYTTATDRAVQEVGGAITGQLNDAAFFMNNPNGSPPSGTLLIVMGYGGGAKAFKISQGVITSTATSATAADFGSLSGSPTVSANGIINGIMWNISRGGTKLYAYNANDLTQEYWDSGQAANNRDALGSVTKFSVPTVADGQVFVGTANSLVVYGPPAAPTSGPSAPTVLNANAAVFNTVDLTWHDNSSNEDSFTIERTTDNNDPDSWVQVGTTSSNATTYSDTTALATTTYYYRVRAHNTFNGNTYSDYTNIATVTTPQAPPLGNGDGALGQYWNDPLVNGAYVHFSGTPVLTRVDPLINFDWGNGSPAASINVDHFSAMWTGRLQPQFSENYTFLTQSDDGVFFEIRPVGSPTWTVLINNLTDHATTTDSGIYAVSAGAQYEFVMEFYENAGGALAQLSWSSAHTAQQFIPTSQMYSGGAPATPTNLTLTPQASYEIDLNWTDNGTNETGYEVQRQDAGTGNYNTIAMLPANSTAFIDSGLYPDTQYSYRVRALNFTANSAFSNVASLITPIPPNKPTDAHATVVTKTSIAMVWTDTSDNEDGFRVLRSGYVPDQQEDNFNTIQFLPPNSTSFLDTGTPPNNGSIPLQPGTEYDYHIQAYNLGGVNDFSGFTTQTITNAPTTLVATPGGAIVGLTWTAPNFIAADPSDLSFNVYRTTNANGSGAVLIASDVPSPSYTDPSAVNGITYYYTVTAVDLGGESAASNQSFATPSGPDITPPTVIAHLPATADTVASTSTNIDVTFSETVTGVDTTDLVLTGPGAASAAIGTPTNITGTTGRFPVSGLATGTVNVSLAPDLHDIQDLGGNDLANVTWSFTIAIDTTRPTVLSKTPDAGATVTTASTNFDITFSEPVTGIDATDLVLTGTGAAGAVKGTPVNLGSNTWRFPVSGLASGAVLVSLAPSAHAIQDIAGNDLANLKWSFNASIDTAPPTILAKSPDNGATITTATTNIDVIFSEPVTGVDATDLVLSGAGAAGAVKGTPTNITGNTWRFPVSGLVTGAVAVSLAPAVHNIQDAAGNDLANVNWSFAVNLPIAVHINFQDTTSAGYPGYLPDTGLVYGDRGNGYTYGWNVSNTGNTRNRNIPISPDERYDTLIQMGNATTGFTWEIAIPNGTYSVHLVAGDPGFLDSTYKINVESTLLINGTPTTGSRWIENTANITVSDGKLTISNATGSNNDKVDYIDITAAGDTIAPTVSTVATAATNPVTGTSTALSVLGADNLGEPALNYTWSVVSKPAGAANPTFTANATNAAKSTTANFTTSGNYVLRAVIADAAGNAITSDVPVSVNFGFTGITGGAYHSTFDGAAYTVTADSGIVTFSTDLSAGGKTVSLTLAPGAFAILDSTEKLATLTIPAGSTVQMPDGFGHNVLRVTALSIAATAGLNLAGNDLILDYTGNASPAAAIEALVVTGYNGGNWRGAGISSSTAATNTSAYTLGVLDNATRPSPINNFDGVDTSSHQQVLVKFTWLDDLDLDGLITSNDAINFAAHYTEGKATTRSAGDLNYNGVFDSNDAILFAATYNESLAQIGPPPGFASPGALTPTNIKTTTNTIKSTTTTTSTTITSGPSASIQAKLAILNAPPAIIPPAPLPPSKQVITLPAPATLPPLITPKKKSDKQPDLHP